MYEGCVLGVSCIDVCMVMVDVIWIDVCKAILWIDSCKYDVYMADLLSWILIGKGMVYKFSVCVCVCVCNT